jgi:hypothetical protein
MECQDYLSRRNHGSHVVAVGSATAMPLRHHLIDLLI